MKFEILHRFSGAVVATLEGETRNAAIRAAIVAGVNLDYADLSESDLSHLVVVNASFVNASFVNASFVNASFVNASFVNARFVNASFVNARFDGARFDGARFDGARFDGASFDEIKADFYEILSHALPSEVPQFLAALRAGKVNGSVYRDDSGCGCLVGSFEIIRGCQADGFVERNGRRPAEQWFLAIGKGHTPENHPLAAETETWIEEWLLSNPEEASAA